MRILRVYLTLFLCLAGFSLAEEPINHGKLIVTYQTGPKGERLDRVRFWLIDPKLETHLYPKDNGYVDDEELLSRMVVFENLPEGHYQIEFIVPNSDGLFEEVPIKNITIKANTIVKIDQPIKIREIPLSELKFGTLLISYEASNFHDREVLKNIRFKLTDKHGKQSIYPQPNDILVDNLSSGNVFYLNLPTGTYSLEFFLEGNERKMQAVSKEKIIIEEDRMTMLEKSFKISSHHQENKHVDKIVS